MAIRPATEATLMIASASLGDHAAAGGLAHEERAGQVGVEDGLPAVEGNVLGRLAPRDAGIVHEDVDALHGLDDLGDGRGVGDVAEGAVAAKPRARKRSTAGSSHCGTAGQEHQGSAGFGKPFGHLFTEAPRAAGDQGNPAGKVENFLHPDSLLLTRSLSYG